MFLSEKEFNLILSSDHQQTGFGVFTLGQYRVGLSSDTTDWLTFHLYSLYNKCIYDENWSKSLKVNEVLPPHKKDNKNNID